MKKIALIIFISLLGCNKNNPKPNEKFYCQIEGVAFRTSNGGDVFNSPLCAEWNTKGWFNLYGHNFNGNGKSILITTKLVNAEVLVNDKYLLDGSIGSGLYDGDLIYNAKLDRYEHESFNSTEGYLIITKYDKTLKKYQGLLNLLQKVSKLKKM